MKKLRKWFESICCKRTKEEIDFQKMRDEWKTREETLTKIIVEITNDYTVEMTRLDAEIRKKDDKIVELEEQIKKFKT